MDAVKIFIVKKTRNWHSDKPARAKSKLRVLQENLISLMRFNK
jgi:hypothetical protein